MRRMCREAKSLLQVTGGNSFLDLIAKQVDWMKKTYGMQDLKFMLMTLNVTLNGFKWRIVRVSHGFS